MWSLQIMPQDTCFVKKQLYRRGTAVFDAQVGQLETTITPCSRSDIHPDNPGSYRINTSVHSVLDAYNSSLLCCTLRDVEVYLLCVSYPEPCRTLL